jgi:hypothetical protein
MILWGNTARHGGFDHLIQTGSVRDKYRTFLIMNRGILCVDCNAALGHIKDNVIVAEKMVEYLIKNR